LNKNPAELFIRPAKTARIEIFDFIFNSFSLLQLR